MGAADAAKVQFSTCWAPTGPLEGSSEAISERHAPRRRSSPDRRILAIHGVSDIYSTQGNVFQAFEVEPGTITGVSRSGDRDTQC
eukprot:scaffold12992_cov58-Phaeocystis_antarctica.AAC.13